MQGYAVADDEKTLLEDGSERSGKRSSALERSGGENSLETSGGGGTDGGIEPGGALHTFDVELSVVSVPGPQPSALRFFTQRSSMKERCTQERESVLNV